MVAPRIPPDLAERAKRQTAIEIAAELGVQRQTVQRWAREAGITLHRVKFTREQTIACFNRLANDWDSSGPITPRDRTPLWGDDGEMRGISRELWQTAMQAFRPRTGAQNGHS